MKKKKKKVTGFLDAAGRPKHRLISSHPQAAFMFLKQTHSKDMKEMPKHQTD